MTYKIIIEALPEGYKQTLYVRHFYFLWAIVSQTQSDWPFTETVQEWQRVYNIPNNMIKLPFISSGHLKK